MVISYFILIRRSQWPILLNKKILIIIIINMLHTNRKVADSIPDVTGFFNWPNPSSRTMTLYSTQPLTGMSTRNVPGGKGRPACKVDNLTAICEPIV
jgi:hypothetical protein